MAEDAGGRAIDHHGSETRAPHALLAGLILFSGVRAVTSDSQMDQADPLGWLGGTSPQDDEAMVFLVRSHQVGRCDFTRIREIHVGS